MTQTIVIERAGVSGVVIPTDGRAVIVFGEVVAIDNEEAVSYTVSPLNEAGVELDSDEYELPNIEPVQSFAFEQAAYQDSVSLSVEFQNGYLTSIAYAVNPPMGQSKVDGRIYNNTGIWFKVGDQFREVTNVYFRLNGEWKNLL